MEILIPLGIVCCLIIFSFLVGEYLNSKLNLFPNVESKLTQKSNVEKDTIYSKNYSSCVHFDTCNKCKKILLKR